jgi:ribosomal protein L20A (L18A)
LELLTSELGRCVFYAYKNITIAVWTGQANLAAAHAVEHAARVMASRHRAGRTYLAFVLDGLPGPTPEATQVFTRLIGQRDGLGCLAYVVEGSGFWASGLRGMINNMYRESGASHRIKIGTSIEEVAAWLSVNHERATGVAVSEAELLEVLSQARKLGGLERA